MKYLPTTFRGLPGQRLISLYYANVVQGRGAVGYVAMEDEQVAGYICGIWDPSALRRSLIQEHWAGLACWGLIHGLCTPQLAGVHLRRILSLASQMNRKERNYTDQPEYELRPVVVAEFARRRGVATALTETILQDAARRGYTSLHLYTEVDNNAAQGLYHKLGFRLLGQVIRQGMPFLYYERRLSAQLWMPASLPNGSVVRGIMW